MIALWLAACQGDAPAAAEAAPKRIVAFGDVHGDLAAAQAALRLGGLIDAAGRWSGGQTIAVQVGDQLDRGDQEQMILDLFEDLRAQAQAAGGAFYPLLGNHEVMNAELDLRYVTPGGFADFADIPVDPADAALAGVQPEMRGRVAAFRPGGPYARKLAEHKAILQVEGTLFAHGGVLPAHIAYGLDRINAETSAWLRGEREEPAILRGEDSPLWSRHYSQDTDAADCALLRETLAAAGAKRMIVAHTPQEQGINAACDGAVWRVDVGMARHYGGAPAVLEIVGDAIRVLQ